MKLIELYKIEKALRNYRKELKRKTMLMDRWRWHSYNYEMFAYQANFYAAQIVELEAAKNYLKQKRVS